MLIQYRRFLWVIRLGYCDLGSGLAINYYTNVAFEPRVSCWLSNAKLRMRVVCGLLRFCRIVELKFKKITLLNKLVTTLGKHSKSSIPRNISPLQQQPTTTIQGFFTSVASVMKGVAVNLCIANNTFIGYDDEIETDTTNI
ncbi:hypothetical protein J6590_078040 [Homalodisca vitripennis]|nr:hypothetical protein J6590_078040 [Homalodisca vitripennis]